MFQLGEQVAAQHWDGKWYLGTVASIEGATCTVRFGDGQAVTPKLDEVRPLARAGDVHPGADVYVLFEGDSGFYPAQVVSVDGDQVVAAWADGSGETTVAVGQVVVDTRGMGQALEAASATSKRSGETDIFITPGFRFRAVERLITNFHLPKSTLLMLACAFGGTEHVMRAYRHAVEQRYRFFSYGDAMLIERAPQ